MASKTLACPRPEASSLQALFLLAIMWNEASMVRSNFEDFYFQKTVIQWQLFFTYNSDISYLLFFERLNI